MRRIRILHVLPDLRVGGAERMVVHLVQGLNAARHEVGVVSLFDRRGTELEELLENAGITTWYLGKRIGLDLRMFRRVDAIIREFRPQVVHTHLYVLRYVLPSVILRRLATVHTVHSIAEKEVDFIGSVIHSIAFRTKVVPVAIAEKVRESLQRRYKLTGIPLIFNGIPVRNYWLSGSIRKLWRAKQGVGPDVPVIVCVARLSPPKNHRMLLEAFARGPARFTQAKLWLVGDGELRAALERQVRDMGLQGRVRFWGWRSDIPEILAASDIFALASTWEGNPLAVMEAMAAGKPVVATDVGGLPELIDSGLNGILLSSGDVEGFAHALVQLVRDVELRERMGRAARCVAERRFDVSVMVREYEALYERILSQS